MQDKKEKSHPVRIRDRIFFDIEQFAIDESKRRGRLLTIGEVANELLEQALNDQGEKSGK